MAKEIKVFDKGGKWFVNTALFRFNDPTPRADGEQINFEPGVPTKVAETEWLKGQELIVEIEDPHGDLPPQIEPEEPNDTGVPKLPEGMAAVTNPVSDKAVTDAAAATVKKTDSKK